MKIIGEIGCGIKDIIDSICNGVSRITSSLLGGIADILDVLLTNIINLVKALISIPPILLNQIGVQRLGAIMTLTTYCYMTVASITVAPTFFTVMIALNGLHAGKSIYGKGANSNSK